MEGGMEIRRKGKGDGGKVEGGKVEGERGKKEGLVGNGEWGKRKRRGMMFNCLL